MPPNEQRFAQQTAAEGGKKEGKKMKGEQEQKRKPEVADGLLEQNRAARQEQLRVENEALAKSVEQRKILVLDFVRRGRLAQGRDFPPEAIDAFPKLLKKLGTEGNPLNEILGEPFDSKQAESKVAEAMRAVESDVRGEDESIRQALSTLGVECKPGVFVDRGQFTFIQTVMRNALNRMSPESIARSKSVDPQTEARLKAKDMLKQLADVVDGDEEALLAKAQEITSLAVEFPDKSGGKGNALAEAIRREVGRVEGKGSKMPPGFSEVPRLSEYAGEVVKPEQIKIGKAHENLEIIGRSTIPAALSERRGRDPLYGATIIDGNIGYGEEGDIRDVDGVQIIDHHDQLERRYTTSRSETATTLVVKIIKERMDLARGIVEAEGEIADPKEKDRAIWKKAMELYLSDFGATVGDRTKGEVKRGEKSGGEVRKLRSYINHLDSDSVLSTWAFRNPRMAMKYQDEIAKISTCGDFLLGSAQNERGVTARDYEYIIGNYIKQCEMRVKEEKIKKASESFNARMQEMAAAVFSDPDVGLSGRQLDLANPVEDIKKAKKDLETGNAELKQLRSELDAAPPAEKRVVSDKIKNHPAMAKLEALGVQLKPIATERAKAESTAKGGRLNEEDNARILSHMHETMEDILTQPFKYKEFLEMGRQAEQRTIERMEKAYQTGEIEIRPDVGQGAQNNGILIVEPGAGKRDIPNVDSIDGQYFFLRRRVDFNQPVVVMHEGQKVRFCINTQNQQGLDAYDFNSLTDTLKERELKIIEEQIGALKAKESDGSITEAEKTELTAKQQEFADNKQGLNWRNRTQMVFCLKKTNIPFQECMQILRDWKQNEEGIAPERAKAEKKQKQDKRAGMQVQAQQLARPASQPPPPLMQA